MTWWGEVLVAVALIVAVVGSVLPILPGALLAWIAIAVWAALEGTFAAWTVLVVATMLLAAGQVLKYLIPGRSLRQADVPGVVIAAGAVTGLVGFFVVPVIGLPLGFVLGVWVATVWRRRGVDGSWTDTWTAIKSAGVSVLIETTSVILAAGVWGAGVVASNPAV